MFVSVSLSHSRSSTLSDPSVVHLHIYNMYKDQLNVRTANMPGLANVQLTSVSFNRTCHVNHWSRIPKKIPHPFLFVKRFSCMLFIDKTFVGKSWMGWGSIFTCLKFLSSSQSSSDDVHLESFGINLFISNHSNFKTCQRKNWAQTIELEWNAN